MNRNPEQSAPETFETTSLEQTYSLGHKLAARLGQGDCLAMIGPLGAGKTALVRGIAKGMGLADERIVSSPTYVLVQEYAAKTKIFHVDLYRLGDPGVEIADLGLDEMLAGGLVLIEWADRGSGQLPPTRWEIKIEITGEESRRFTLSGIHQ